MRPVKIRPNDAFTVRGSGRHHRGVVVAIDPGSAAAYCMFMDDAGHPIAEGMVTTEFLVRGVWPIVANSQAPRAEPTALQALPIAGELEAVGTRVYGSGLVADMLDHIVGDTHLDWAAMEYVDRFRRADSNAS